jgi:xanthine dehydrogenase iron-sulfur cluster and FAD-binding subunit A
LVDGKRVLSCLSLAAQYEGRDVTTIEGLARDGELHSLQEAFIRHDGFQCGYCTPGQIMSAVALLNEGRAGSDEEIREFMSGNLCRTGLAGTPRTRTTTFTDRALRHDLVDALPRARASLAGGRRRKETGSSALVAFEVGGKGGEASTASASAARLRRSGRRLEVLTQ